MEPFDGGMNVGNAVTQKRAAQQQRAVAGIDTGVIPPMCHSLLAPLAKGDLFDADGNMPMPDGLEGEIAAIFDTFDINGRACFAPRNVSSGRMALQA